MAEPKACKERMFGLTYVTQAMTQRAMTDMSSIKELVKPNIIKKAVEAAQKAQA